MRHLASTFLVLALGLGAVGCRQESTSLSSSDASYKVNSLIGVSSTCTPPEFTGALTVELGQSFTLSYSLPRPRWVIFSPEGEIIFTGPTITFTINELGEYAGQVWGQNSCGETHSQAFVVVVLPPMGAPSLVINNGATSTSSSQVQLALAATNSQEMYVTNDASCESGGNWAPVQATLPWTLSGQGTDVRVYARFRTPARTTECVSDGIIYDVTAPVVEFVTTPQAKSYVPQASFEFRAVDNASGIKSFECSLQNAAFQVCPLKLDLNVAKYDTYSMRIRATDNAGNVSEIKEYTWQYLNTPPRVQILSGPDLVTDLTSATFTFNGSDDHAALAFECRLDQLAPVACKSPAEWAQLSSGDHQFSVVAIDDHGLRSEPATYSWKINKIEEPPKPPVVIPPVVQLTQTPETSTQDTWARFMFTATHSGVGIKNFVCQIDSLAEENCQSPHYYTQLSAGIHSFSIYALDNDGLRSEPVSYRWEVLAPRIPITESYTIDSRGRKLDIVVVVDNSASMREEQKKMGQRFSTFLSRLTGIDWQLGIITTDAKPGKQNWKDGRLVPFVGLKNAFSINGSTPNVQKVFTDTVVRKEKGASDEEGIHALFKMFQRPENRFLVRDQSHVASIVISDEDEKSHGKNLKTENQPENLISTFKKLYGNSNTYSHHSIVLQPGYNRKTCPQNGLAVYGDTYVRLSKLTEGVVGDICAADYGDILKNIGDLARERSFSAVLKCDPVGPVQVSLDPQQNIAHTIVGRELRFSVNPTLGTKVTLTYYCQ